MTHEITIGYDDRFIMIHNDQLDALIPACRPVAVSVFVALMRRAKRTDGMRCIPSLSTIADDAGVSRSSVKNAVRELVTAGLLRVEQRHDDNGDLTSNRYTILRPSETPKQDDVTPGDKGGAPENLQVGHDVSNGVGHDVTSNKTKSKQDEDEQENSAPADADRAAVVPAVPEPSEKPRTPKQIENDRRHERRVSLYAAYCDGIGIDPDGEAADVYRDRAFRDLKSIVDKAAPTPDEFRACTRWMNLQAWRDEPPKVTQVIGSYAGWVSKGRPATPEGAKSTPAPKRPANQRGYSADELMQMGMRKRRQQ